MKWQKFLKNGVGGSYELLTLDKFHLLYNIANLCVRSGGYNVMSNFGMRVNEDYCQLDDDVLVELCA